MKNIFESTEEEKNRIRRLHKNYSIIKEADYDQKDFEKKVFDGSNLDYITTYIWEPDTPAGDWVSGGHNETAYQDKNARVLIDYIQDNIGGTFKQDGYFWVKTKDGTTDKFALKDNGEWIEIYVCGDEDTDEPHGDGWKKVATRTNEDDCTRVNKVGKWGADSTGGKSFDRTDVEEIFAAINMEDYLIKTNTLKEPVVYTTGPYFTD